MEENRICRVCGTRTSQELVDGVCPKCSLAKDSADDPHEMATLELSGIRIQSEPLRSPSGQSMFGEYELLNEIARGGMGVVYRAKHKQLRRVVALKMILGGPDASQNDIERFKREAGAAAKLDHPGIVPIYEVGEHDGRHFFAMKFIEGGSLAEHLPKLRSDVRVTMRVIEQVARAVHYAHQRGILHRDLKPGNILMDEGGNPLITDLGLARDIETKSDLTNSGAIVGTPSYMSPEQASGSQEITTATDIYAVGAILYEALTGKPPHRANSAIETLMRVIEKDAKPPREIDPRIDRTLELICMKCLQREPNQRYASAAAVADDLNQWSLGKPVSVRPQSMTAAFGSLLQANLRTALGAAVLGGFAGWLLAICFGQLFVDPNIVSNPPESVYSALPGSMPVGASLITIKPRGTGPLAFYAAAIVLMGIGLFTAWLIRPRPGSEAFAIGLVASLVMSTTLFTFHWSYWMLKISHDGTKSKVVMLAEAALSNEQNKTEAMDKVYREFPTLNQLDPQVRAHTLAYRIYYDSILSLPMMTISAILASAAICMLPCVLGTCFASKLLFARVSAVTVLREYFEFLLMLVFVMLLGFFQTILPRLGANIPDFGLGLVGSLTKGLLLYALLIGMAVQVYRRDFRWPKRLIMYFLVAVVISSL